MYKAHHFFVNYPCNAYFACLSVSVNWNKINLKTTLNSSQVFGSLSKVLSAAQRSFISNSFAVQECSCRGPVNQGWRKLPSAPPPGQQSPVSQPPPPFYR